MTDSEERILPIAARMNVLKGEVHFLKRRVAYLEEPPDSQALRSAHNTDEESHAVEKVREWLEPLLAGGLSAARSAPIGVTAERLAETILIGLGNVIHGRPTWFVMSGDTPVPLRPT
jgi:hypothetical protein